MTAPTEVFTGQTAGTSTTKIRPQLERDRYRRPGVASYKLQVSVNGGTYATITSATTKTTSEPDSSRPAGRTASGSAPRTRKATSATTSYGPTLMPTRYSEGPSSKVTYVGTWPAKSTSHALGGKTPLQRHEHQPRGLHLHRLRRRLDRDPLHLERHGRGLRRRRPEPDGGPRPVIDGLSPARLPARISRRWPPTRSRSDRSATAASTSTASSSTGSDPRTAPGRPSDSQSATLPRALTGRP